MKESSELLEEVVVTAQKTKFASEKTGATTNIDVYKRQLQLFQTTDAAYKVNTLVGTKVFDAEHFIQYQIGGDGYIQCSASKASVPTSVLTL